MNFPNPEKLQAYQRGEVGPETGAQIEASPEFQAALDRLWNSAEDIPDIYEAAQEEAFGDDECRLHRRPFLSPPI
jgi:hypothetical protein